MIERSIEWLKKAELNKRFYVCKEADRKHVSDPDFENWIIADSRKHVSVWFGESFKTDESQFSFVAGAYARPKTLGDPFAGIKAFTTRYTCSWDYVTKVYQGDGGGYVYIFVRKSRPKSKKSK